MDYNIYALYEDENDTLLKSDIYRVTIKTPEVNLENLTGTISEKPYIDIRFNEYDKNELNVYIKGEEQLIKKYGPDANHAIQHWEEVLKAKTGNYGSWRFKIFNSHDFPRLLETKQYPIDILVSLEHNDNQKECGSGWGGFAYISWVHRLQNKIRNEPILTRVFTGCGEKTWTQSQVDSITSHEFAHALGLGHAWNEYGDMMCSRDYARNFRWIFQTAEILPPGIRAWLLNTAGILPQDYKISTCGGSPDNYVDTGKPSEFNIGAIIYAYGRDGFASPNPRIFADTIYTCDKEPKLCQSSKQTTSSKQDKVNNAISSDDKTNNPYRLIVYLDGASKTNAIGDNFKIVIYNSNHKIILSEKPTIDFTDTHQKISPKSGYTIQGKSGEHPNQIRVCAQQGYQLDGKEYLHDDCYPIKQNNQKTYWYTIFDYGQIDGFEGDTQDKADKIVASKSLAKNQIQSMNKTHKQSTQFSADLVGEAEVPPIFSESYGNAVIVGTDNGTFNYQINVTSLDKVTSAHLYQGNVVVNGEPLVTLFNSKKPTEIIDGTLVEGTINSSSISLPVGNLTGNLISTDSSAPPPANKLAALIDLMSQNMTYVNIHTSKFPDGELRGQLIATATAENLTDFSTLGNMSAE